MVCFFVFFRNYGTQGTRDQFFKTLFFALCVCVFFQIVFPIHGGSDIKNMDASDLFHFTSSSVLQRMTVPKFDKALRSLGLGIYSSAVMYFLLNS